MSKETARPLAWGHINLNVRNLDRSIAFYQKLGFEVFIPGIPYLALTSAPAPNEVPPEVAAALGLPEAKRGRACIMQLGDGFPKLDLTEFEGDTGSDPPSNADRGFVRICLASSDLNGDYDRLRSEGVVFLSPPTAGKDGLADIAICRDPDGALIELIELHLERWGR